MIGRAARSEFLLPILASGGFFALAALLLMTPLGQIVANKASEVVALGSSGESRGPAAGSFGYFTLNQSRASLAGGTGHVLLRVTLRFDRQEVWEVSGRKAGDDRAQDRLMVAREGQLQDSLIQELEGFRLQELSSNSGLLRLKEELAFGFNDSFDGRRVVDDVLLKDFLLIPSHQFAFNDYHHHYRTIASNAWGVNAGLARTILTLTSGSRLDRILPPKVEIRA
jgi:flagellar basal body-associated protein FliL